MDEKIIIPIGLFLLACWSTYRGIKASKSGSQAPDKYGRLVDTAGNVPFYKTFAGVCAIGLFIATIVVIIVMINEK